ncbi:hypothetical protein BDV96DRAFT_582091 [Lophiotrema nucula]|uniref:Uncharacterized protein n=1 Tax=Lophiotrema nucula TaxID=690887 RepID=A0A6A5YW91_9PLEO|nr:hypothetical protein BDV96DRAFT_582091 [Lophiotrema nucula]
MPAPTNIKLVGFTEFTTLNDKTYKRRRGTQPWLPIEDSPPGSQATSSEPSSTAPDITRKDFFTLYLLRQNQYPDEPLHWSLVISPTDGFPVSRGPRVSSFENHVVYCSYVFQVRGDENMNYEPESLSKPVELLDCVHSTYALVRFDWDGLKKAQGIAEKEEPPRARTWGERTENCQHWSVRVVRKLVDEGLVEEAKIGMMREMV